MGERERKTEKREGSINVTLTSLFCFIFYQVREIRGKKSLGKVFRSLDMGETRRVQHDLQVKLNKSHKGGRVEFIYFLNLRV